MFECIGLLIQCLLLNLIVENVLLSLFAFSFNIVGSLVINRVNDCSNVVILSPSLYIVSILKYNTIYSITMNNLVVHRNVTKSLTFSELYV